METPVMHTSPKTHTWIIVLLVWVIALLIFLAGYMIYRDQSTANVVATDSGASCSEEIAIAMKEYEDGKSDDEPLVCPEGSGIVSASASRPGFIYPESWHISGGVDVLVGSERHWVHASDEPIFSCDGCDMRVSDVIMTTEPHSTFISKGTYATYTEAYLAQFEGTEGYSDVQKSSTTTSNGLQTVISGKLTENTLGGPGTFEYVLFEGATTIVLVNFENSETFPGNVDGWNIIKNSLDFSKVE